MRYSLPVLLAVLVLAGVCSAQHPKIGVNLSESNYFTEEYAFTDLTSNFAPIFSQENGASWGVGDEDGVLFGTDGYPSFIANDHSARTIWDAPKGYTGGQHVVLWDGTGSVLAGGTASSTGRMEISLPESPSSSFRTIFDITSTMQSDPLRNLRIVPLSREADYTGGQPSNPFRSEFIDRWSSMDGGFRYMDWSVTNNSPLSNWTDRSKPSDISQGTERGVAIEHQIAHANLTQTNPWFNIPHLATDSYIQNMATLIRDTLDPNLKARVEYSNEVWNGQFSQAQHAISQAPTIGEASDGLGGLRWYSKRSVDMFDIFENVFTEGGMTPDAMERLVRVMSSQAANDWVAQQILEYDDAYLKVDALAIAPYFGNAVSSSGVEDWKNATWAERIEMVDQSLQFAMNNMDDHATLLGDGGNYSDIALFAYEAGQHFLGLPETHGDTEFTELMQELNRRPEMREWYFDYLTHWDQIGGEDMMLFSSMGENSRWGSWGLYEYEGQPLSEAYKMQGVLDYMQSVSVPEPGSMALLSCMATCWILRRQRRSRKS